MLSPSQFLVDHYPPERFSANLSRITEAFALFDISNDSFEKVITVAGTNGKGTVSRGVYQGLLLNNCSCALFTSPHLISIEERFSYLGKNIESSNLLFLFEETHNLLLKHELSLSFYEFIFLCFAVHAKSLKVDYLVLEVGLGGRLDATNVLDCDLGLITSISRDHVEILGNSYKKILFEKLGIAKKRSKILYSFSLDYLNIHASKYLAAKGISFFSNRELNSIEAINNWLVSTSLEELGFKGHDLDSKVFTAYDKGLLFSTSHNIDAVRKFVQSLELNPPKQKPLLLLSYSHREFKELEYMNRLFLKLKEKGIVSEIKLTHLDQFKCASVESLKLICEKLGLAFVEKDRVVNVIKEYKCILLSGSNYFIGDFIRMYEKSIRSKK